MSARLIGSCYWLFISLCQMTIHHLEEAGLNDPCIISPLNIEQTAPSAGKKGSSCSSLDESDEESEMESTSTGGAYTQRAGANLLSSSSSSSSSLTQPKPPPVVSSNQEPYSQRNALISTGSPSRAGLELRVGCGGRPKEEEEKDVNLLTLTFGRVEQEEEEEKKSDFIVEEVAFDSVLAEEGATETVHDEEEEEEVCGYMGRSGIWQSSLRCLVIRSTSGFMWARVWNVFIFPPPAAAQTSAIFILTCRFSPLCWYYLFESVRQTAEVQRSSHCFRFY